MALVEESDAIAIRMITIVIMDFSIHVDHVLAWKKTDCRELTLFLLLNQLHLFLDSLCAVSDLLISVRLCRESCSGPQTAEPP